MTPTSVLAGVVLAEGAAIAWLAREVRRLRTEVVCEELHGLPLDGKVQALQLEQARHP
jgi:hypothetical protein